MSKLWQVTQVKNSQTYTDANATGSGMETPVAANQNLEFDLNSIRTMLKQQLDPTGALKWYDPPTDNFGLQQIHDKEFARWMPIVYGTTDFTLGVAAMGVLLANTQFAGGAGFIAVGAASTFNGGYLAADAGANFPVAGALGTPSTTNIADPSGVLLNQTLVISATTNEPVLGPGNQQVFGLFQTVSGTTDGTAIAGAGAQNVRLSFVYRDETTDLLTLFTLPIGTYHFGALRQQNFNSLTKGAFIAGIAVDNSNEAGTEPFREADITVTIPAGTALTITTFGTTYSSLGTVALPATGPAFRDNMNIRLYRNGVLQSKGPGLSTPRDAYWLSATTFAFATDLFSGEVIRLETPASF